MMTSEGHYSGDSWQEGFAELGKQAADALIPTIPFHLLQVIAFPGQWSEQKLVSWSLKSGVGLDLSQDLRLLELEGLDPEHRSEPLIMNGGELSRFFPDIAHPVCAVILPLRSQGFVGGILVLVRSRKFAPEEISRARGVLGLVAMSLACFVQRMELARTERQYRSVIENARESVVVVQNGKTVFMNDYTSTIFGVTREEALGTNAFDIFHPEDRPMVADYNRRRLSGEQVPDFYRARYRNRDGKVGWLQMGVMMCQWEGSPGVVVFCSEVSEFVEAEQGLKKSEELYRSLFEGSMDGICFVDAQGRILDFNTSYSQMLGYSRTELLGKDIYQITPPRWREWERREILEGSLVQRGASGTYEKELIRKDGTIFPVELNTYRIGEMDGPVPPIFWGAVRDISDRVQAEERFHWLFNSMIDGFALHEIILNEGGEPVDYRFLSVNPAFERLVGFPSEAIVGRRVLEVMPELEHEWIERYGRVALTGESAHFELLSGPLGKIFEVSAFSPSRGRFACTFADVTERRQAENELKKQEAHSRELEQQLFQSRKLEAVGRLAGGIAHDFNNILTGISGNVSLALDDVEEGDSIRLMLEDIGKAADRAAELTSQLLAFGRRQMMMPRVIDLSELVRNLDRLLSRLISEDIILHTLASGSACLILADAAQIEQVLMNLVVNARDAMPEGGKLMIETSTMDLETPLWVSEGEIPAGSYAVLKVTDTGTGMDSETRSRAFEPFFSTKPEGRGTGLGLATVFGIVSQHNGGIDLRSIPGEGTTVRVFLPSHGGEKEMVKQSKTEAPPKGKETILIVEDEPMVLSIAEKILKRQGYHTLTADCGEDALRLVEQNTEPIDLLLSDVIMPGMNGRDLAERARARLPEMKVLFTSGYTEDFIVHKGVLEKGIQFLAKPYRPDSLAKKVRAVLDGVTLESEE